MYNEECRKEIDKFFEVLNSRRNNLPSELAIFNLLETFSYDRSVIGNSLEHTTLEIVKNAFSRRLENPNYTNGKRIRESRDELDIIDKEQSDDYNKNYRFVVYNSFVAQTEEHKGIAVNDVIWLHFPILPENIKPVTEELLKILHANDLSYYLRLATVVGPDSIVIGVYDKASARILLDSCENNRIVQDSIMLNNPFMPHINGIGIVKEMRNLSYTRHMSTLIYEYAQNSEDKKLTFHGFCKYVKKMFDSELKNRTYQERQMDYQVLLGLFTIHEQADYLENLIHLPKITYKKEEFDNYRVTYENNEYCYTNRDGETVTSSNFTEWLKLQAYNCIQRMYYERTGELPKEDLYLSGTFMGDTSGLIDDIICEERFQVTSNYRDLMINDLYPYLVGYYACESKMATEDEIRKVISKVQARMVKKIQVTGENKNFYQIEDKTIQSTIPPIRVDNALIGIEYLDYDLNYCNVFIYENDNVRGYLGIFLDTEKNKIWEENDVACSVYRASVARALCRYEELKKEPMVRGPLEGLLVHLGGDEYTPEESTINPPRTIA